MNLIASLLLAQLAVAGQQVLPVLDFPEPGMDDTAAYRGYRTRFFRDAHGNAFQVYLDGRTGRVVHVWANASNESAGFTARDGTGRPAPLAWGSAGASVDRTGRAHAVTYDLEAAAGRIDLGFFLLGSMRVERDFQYREGHLRPFGAEPFHLPELTGVIENLARLDEPERRRHIALLDAADLETLRARLAPAVTLASDDAAWLVRAERPSFDGRNRIALEVAVDRDDATVEVSDGVARIRSRAGGPIRLRVRVATDAVPLTPLTRDEIFNPEFLRFLADARAAHDRARDAGPPGADDPDRAAAIARYRWLERHVRSAELLATREKLMAGMPNYATYFGRDMLMTSLMMEPVWADAMLEHVIGSVLRKLSADGEVSHEEALGGQAIRENAAAYNAVLDGYSRGGTGRDTLLARARAILGDLQAVRENYGMMDDDFQLPVVAARYLGSPRIARQRKHEFLDAPAREGDPASRLALLLRNLAHVARAAGPYARDPVAENLVAFPKRDATRWFAGSWRDSGPGYANGRFAMDVNAIWVPHALEATATILVALRELGYDAGRLEALTPDIRGTPLAGWLRDPASLRRTVETWRGAERHFRVTLPTAEAYDRVDAWLAGRPAPERRAWVDALRTDPLDGRPLEFLALSLDSAGRPIPVAATDPAMGLFLGDIVDGILAGATTPDEALRPLEVFLLPYPLGLFIPDVGPVATNDVYATPAIQAAFREDPYHSPTTIWGREVNLLLLGLARQLERAFDGTGELRDPALAPTVRALDDALRRVLGAVEASGLKHNELWSYRIDEGRPAPVRYGSSTDIQLWNATDLAVQFRLARLPGLTGPISLRRLDTTRSVALAAAAVSQRLRLP